MEKNYKTKQRAKILSYLSENKTSHITAEQIIKYFKDMGEPIGKSTVYRYLESLVRENIVRKFVTPERASSACFQYIDKEHNCQAHYHMKCIVCGALIHLDCKQIEELSNHIFKEHGFKVDECKTILYGKCEKCLNLYVTN